MIGTKIAFVFMLPFAAAAATDNQQYWIEKAKENAKKDLDRWPQSVDKLADNESKPVEDQVAFFQSQVADSVDNMKSFVPQLIWVVDNINSIAADEPNFIRRGALHTILWYIKGKRDNKSYYLLDGAVNWVSNRVSELSSKGGRASNLASKLTDAQKAAANLRDELDSAAQQYVVGITKIQELSDDITKNIIEIRALANKILDTLQSSPLLKNADSTKDLVKSIAV